MNSPRLARYLPQVFDRRMPMLVVPVLLSSLEQGALTRPIGGSGRFRDALIARFHELGGEVDLDTTVDEIIVESNRAVGVRLADGRIVRGDLVVSTSSTPETIFRLLGGRHGSEEMEKRLASWQTFEPIVLASFGVDRTFDDQPTTQLFDEIAPLHIGATKTDHLYLRLFHDDPSLAPRGHTIAQTMMPTTYDWWASRGARYQAEKEHLARTLKQAFDDRISGFARAVDMTDIATPLTFWRAARSWRGAYEGWLPTPDNFFTHVPKEVPGLEQLYLAGQWVEPGGGVPIALLSGRQLVQILCARTQREFRP